MLALPAVDMLAATLLVSLIPFIVEQKSHESLSCETLDSQPRAVTSVVA